MHENPEPATTDSGRVYQVVAIVGSLRAGSFNRALYRAATELQPPGLAITEAPIRDVPVFDEDVEDAGDPPAVTALREAIAAADGVLIVTPEYNAAIPGVLKNALDWASRTHNGSRVLWDKPAALMGATPGRYGTTRSQLALRSLLGHIGMRVMPKPDVAIARVRTLLDDEGNLVDAETRDKVREHLVAFHDWIDTFAQHRGTSSREAEGTE
jgi:chromate reductase